MNANAKGSDAAAELRAAAGMTGVELLAADRVGGGAGEEDWIAPFARKKTEELRKGCRWVCAIVHGRLEQDNLAFMELWRAPDPLDAGNELAAGRLCDAMQDAARFESPEEAVRMGWKFAGWHGCGMPRAVFPMPIEKGGAGERLWQAKPAARAEA